MIGLAHHAAHLSAYANPVYDLTRLVAHVLIWIGLSRLLRHVPTVMVVVLMVLACVALVRLGRSLRSKGAHRW